MFVIFCTIATICAYCSTELHIIGAGVFLAFGIRFKKGDWEQHMVMIFGTFQGVNQRFYCSCSVKINLYPQCDICKQAHIDAEKYFMGFWISVTCNCYSKMLG